MSRELLELLADFLQYLAVPAAALEFLKLDHREAVERWLGDALPKLVRSLAASVVLLYVAVLALVIAGPWLVLMYMIFGKVMYYAISHEVEAESGDGEPPGGCMMLNCSFWVLVFFAAVLEKWLIPESWIVSLSRPFEAFSMWANQFAPIAWLFPEFAAQEFLAYFREVFTLVEGWLWDWLAWLYGFYFFLTRGLMVVLAAAVQIFFLLATAVALGLVVLFPLHMIMMLSEKVKRRLQLQAFGRLPIAAFLVWATGETIEFSLRLFGG